jgi:hypothetical protein
MGSTGNVVKNPLRESPCRPNQGSLLWDSGRRSNLTSGVVITGKMLMASTNLTPKRFWCGYCGGAMDQVSEVVHVGGWHYHRIGCLDKRFQRR